MAKSQSPPAKSRKAPKLQANNASGWTTLELPTDAETKSVTNEKNKADVALTLAPLPTPSPTPMPSGRLALLICGIGNPGTAYANTYHSAGLTIIKSLADRLGYPNFRKDKTLGNGLVSKSSHSEDAGAWTLWQSTSYMNESGKGVRAAWTQWSREFSEGEARLVVVYDELEKPLGTVTVRIDPKASAKGHNGLRSIMSVMGNIPFVRIGIGIGRPVSREPDDVMRYVLQQRLQSEHQKILHCVDQVIAKLKQLEAV